MSAQAPHTSDRAWTGLRAIGAPWCCHLPLCLDGSLHEAIRLGIWDVFLDGSSNLCQEQTGPIRATRQASPSPAPPRPGSLAAVEPGDGRRWLPAHAAVPSKFRRLANERRSRVSSSPQGPAFRSPAVKALALHPVANTSAKPNCAIKKRRFGYRGERANRRRNILFDDGKRE